MQYRKAKKEDFPGIVCLWQIVFGDDEPFILRCLNIFSGFGNTYVASEKDTIIAQLLSVPCKNNLSKGVYLYALATHPKWQQQGVMKALMQYAEKECKNEGALFSALIPATPALFAFYKKQGYNTQTLLNHFSCTAGQGGAGLDNVATGILSAEEFLTYRRKFAPPSRLNFNHERYSMVLEDFYDQGGTVIYGGAGYALLLPKDDYVYIPEIFAESRAVFMELLSTACKVTGKKQAKGTAGQQLFGEPFEDDARQRPFAMFKLLGDNPMPTPYIRMALEEFF